MVSVHVQKRMEQQNMRLTYEAREDSKKNKYSKQLHVKYFEGYDLLENLLVARPYIQKKHGIDLGLFELLLCLYGKKYFTQKDYAELPKQFKYRSVKNLLNTGFVVVVQNGENLGKHIYKLNSVGANIIKEFYEVLSGEKQYSEKYNNPLARKKTRTAFDKRKMELIMKINRDPAPEKKKPLYR